MRIIAVLLSLAPFCSFAEPVTAGESNPLDTITVTATRVEAPLSTQSSSLSVVTKQDIEQVSAVHISELMVRVPGVWITRGNGQEHLTAIRSPVLTGAGSCGAFYMAEDGVPVRPTGFCNVNQLFDTNSEQAQRIEVLRGPGTVLHSSDAVHGVINVISEAPVPWGSEPETSFQVEAGPDDYGRVKLGTSDRIGQVGYRVSVNGASDHGYQDDSGFDQQKLTARLDYEGAQWSSFSLLNVSNLNQETAGYVVGEDAYKDDQLRKQNPNPEAYRDSQAVRWQTHFERVLEDDSVLIVTPFARHSEMDFLMHFLPGQPIEENGQNSAGVQTTYIKSITDRLQITTGIDMEITEAFLKQYQPTESLWFLPAGQHYDYEVNAQLGAAFLSTEYQWTEKLGVIMGGRYEQLRYDYNNGMISGNTDEEGNQCVSPSSGATGCRYTRPEDRKDDFENTSLNLGLVYRFSDALIASSRFSHGFRAPQATELYRLQSGQEIANLDSEEISSIEVSVKGTLNDFSYDLVGFYMTKDNVIFQSAARQNIDNGETRHYGLEYQLFWPFSDHWYINAGGSFARHQYTSDVSAPGSDPTLSTDGNDMVSAPSHMGSVQVAWQPSSKTSLELEWVSMGKYYTDLENDHHYDGHQLLNLRLRQQLTNRVSAGLRLLNLTDRYYAERADYSGFAGDRYFIGKPRSLYADIRATF